jgi:hypothetical protein
MNIKAINEFRLSQGLAPHVPKKPAKKSGNASKHAQACRDLKAARNSGKKK